MGSRVHRDGGIDDNVSSASYENSGEIPGVIRVNRVFLKTLEMFQCTCVLSLSSRCCYNSDDNNTSAVQKNVVVKRTCV